MALAALSIGVATVLADNISPAMAQMPAQASAVVRDTEGNRIIIRRRQPLKRKLSTIPRKPVKELEKLEEAKRKMDAVVAHLIKKTKEISFYTLDVGNHEEKKYYRDVVQAVKLLGYKKLEDAQKSLDVELERRMITAFMNFKGLVHLDTAEKIRDAVAENINKLKLPGLVAVSLTAAERKEAEAGKAREETNIRKLKALKTEVEGLAGRFTDMFGNIQDALSQKKFDEGANGEAVQFLTNRSYSELAKTSEYIFSGRVLSLLGKYAALKTTLDAAIADAAKITGKIKGIPIAEIKKEKSPLEKGIENYTANLNYLAIDQLETALADRKLSSQDRALAHLYLGMCRYDIIIPTITASGRKGDIKLRKSGEEFESALKIDRSIELPPGAHEGLMAYFHKIKNPREVTETEAGKVMEVKRTVPPETTSTATATLAGVTPKRSGVVELVSLATSVTKPPLYQRGDEITASLELTCNQPIEKVLARSQTEVTYEIIEITNEGMYALLPRSAPYPENRTDLRTTAELKEGREKGKGDVYIYLKGKKLVDAQEGREEYENGEAIQRMLFGKYETSSTGAIRVIETTIQKNVSEYTNYIIGRISGKEINAAHQKEEHEEPEYGCSIGIGAASHIKSRGNPIIVHGKSKYPMTM